jgi:hypothetical protein
MSKGGIDRLCEQAAERVQSGIRGGYEWQTSQGTSPIEALFGCAFRIALHHSGLNYERFEGNFWQCGIPPNVVFGCPQVEVLGCYRVDFLLAVQNNTGLKSFVAVECDVHDYHERTKEQAARDRSRDRTMQVAGIAVLRFTGSELYSDPMGCATEVIYWLEARA